MNGAVAALLFLASVTPAPAGSGWSTLPASIGAHVSGLVEVPSPSVEDEVCLVGARNAVPAAVAELRRVFTVELSDELEPMARGRSHTRGAAEAFPDGAHWPDANGRIAAQSPLHGEVSEKPGIRNPWEVRVRQGAAGDDLVFLYGGIIDGGDRGPLAFLNGRAVRAGDSIGKFRVALIAAAALLLERGGSYYVLPMGRRTTITLVGG
jgi:hypothetical protein